MGDYSCHQERPFSNSFVRGEQGEPSRDVFVNDWQVEVSFSRRFTRLLCVTCIQTFCHTFCRMKPTDRKRRCPKHPWLDISFVGGISFTHPTPQTTAPPFNHAWSINTCPGTLALQSWATRVEIRLSSLDSCRRFKWFRNSFFIYAS